MDCVSNRAQFGSGPQAWLLNDETRLHLQHGPIDLIIDALGEHADVRLAYTQATVAFKQVLECLASQLPILRKTYKGCFDYEFVGPVATRMLLAVKPLESFNVTPMIAVAGAVADHVLSRMIKDRNLERAQVNNGGDIALFLSDGASAKIGICTTPQTCGHKNIITLTAEHGIGGIATSGWQGRSHSLGIADAVTVVSNTAATADIAATLIANAVDLPLSDKVTRLPANEIDADSDLGERLVTVMVEPLSESEKNRALSAGEHCAQKLIDLGIVQGCFIHLQGQTRVAGTQSTSRLLSTSELHAYS